MPMSRRRVTAPTAVFVCSVDSTRWPVSARLHRDLRGLEVADFADHHHVRVLAQDGAQAAREGHLDLGVDLGLADAVDVVLDRVLDRHDVAACCR